MTRLLAPALLALLLAAPAAADTRDLSGFSGVNASGRLRVEVSVGPSYSVRVTGTDSDRVVTNVSRGELRIAQRDNSWFGPHRALDAVVLVTAPRFDALRASRGVELQAEGPINASELALSAVQGAALHVSGVNADELDIRASQGGAVEAAGECGAVRASASMGGVLDAEDVDCARAYVSASMGGVVQVHARDLVEANASMGGSIDVSGSPAQNNSRSLMGGAISLN
jgi:hypothetical protein